MHASSTNEIVKVLKLSQVATFVIQAYQQYEYHRYSITYIIALLILK